MKKTAVGDVVWLEEEKVLTLDGEEVLRYRLQWPKIEGSGLGVRRINRCYARMAHCWRRRWQREVYCLACLQLAQRRAAARPFAPWRGELKGEVALWQEGCLSLKMRSEEERGDGRPCQVCWGDVWLVQEGAPLLLKQVLPQKRGWKKNLCRQIIQQGEQRQRAGDCFLEAGWQERIGRLLPTGDFCLWEDRVEFFFPQCTIAPAVEGTPVFWIARGEGECAAGSGKQAV